MVNVANRDRDRGRGGKGRSGFVYKPPDADAVKRRAEQRGGKFDTPWKQGIDVWRPKQGDNDIRILPATWDDHDHHGFDVWVHSYIGADGSTFLCLAKMKNKSCPCCDAAREAKAAGEVEEAKALAARRQVAVWIIDRDDKDENPQIWPMSWTMDRDISELMRNKRSGKVLAIDHPDDGYDISFKRQGSTKTNTKYIGLAIARDPSPISDDAKTQDKIMEFLQENPIPDQLVSHDAEYMDKVLSGVVEKKDDDLDDKEDDRGGRKGKDRDDEEDRPRRRDRDEEDKADEEDRPRERRRARDEEDGDKEEPRERRRSRDEEADKDEPRRARRDDDEEDRPRTRRAARDEEPEKDRDDDPPSKRGGRDEDEEDRPRRRPRDEEDEPRERPRRRA